MIWFGRHPTQIGFESTHAKVLSHTSGTSAIIFLAPYNAVVSSLAGASATELVSPVLAIQIQVVRRLFAGGGMIMLGRYSLRWPESNERADEKDTDRQTYQHCGCQG